MVKHIEQSIFNAVKGISNLTEYELNVKGFSTPTIRHLFNNLCNIDGQYLEVGLYCGATFCSSFNNNLISIGIEDFSQPFGNDSVKEELEINVKNCSKNAKNVGIIDADCFSVNLNNLSGKFDIFFYDGEHSIESQARVLPYFLPFMKDEFIFIVDDFNWYDVSQGTLDGFFEIGEKIDIIKEWNLIGETPQDDPIWHNGIAIYLIRKAI